MNKTQPARGMRDFLPADIRKRNYVIGIIKKVYESYGFEPLETPAVENLETLTGKYGEEGNQLMFKILKRGEKLDVSSGENLSDLALRYDLTVPLARVVANYRHELPKFFKRYQIQPVWRADRPARGRFREFYQCDVDAIGSNSMIVEAELISAVCEILTQLGFDDFMVRLNNRKVLSGILETSGIKEDLHTDALITIDKLDKIGADGIATEFEQKNIPSDGIETMFGFINLLYEKREEALRKQSRHEVNRIVLDMLFDFLRNHKDGTEGLINLVKTINLIEANSEYRDVLIDPFLARGLSYYTGAIMEIVLTKGDFAGSIGGGGRYDGLIGMFGKEQIPACGFSLGLERIIVVMEERGMFPPKLESNAADVLVTIWDEDSIGESLKLASELRNNGLRVLVYPEAHKIDKQLKYASQMNIPFVCLIGEEELKDNKVTLKNMQKREQETVLREEVAGKIK